MNNVFFSKVTDDVSRRLGKKVLIGIISMCLISAVFFVVFYLFIGFYQATYVVSIVGAILIISYYFVRKRQIVEVMTRVVVFSIFGIVTYLIFSTGGISSAFITVLVIVPFVSYMYGAKNEGHFFTILSLLTILLAYILDEYQIEIDNQIQGDYRNLHDLIVKLFSFLFLLVLVGLYDLEVKSSHSDVLKLNKKLVDSEAKLKEMADQAINFFEHLTETDEELHRVLDEERRSKRELQETQSKLIQSEKMASVGLLTGGIAHEINNPVNYVYAGINALDEDLTTLKKVIAAYETVTPENAAQKLPEIGQMKEDILFFKLLDYIDRSVSNIRKGAIRATEIVKGLRAFAQADTSSPVYANIEDNLDYSLILFQNHMGNRIQVERNYAHIPKINCFPGELNQVFVNLISNAIQSIEGAGTIFIQTNQTNIEEKRFVTIIIKDTGKGMSEAIMDKIFEPFFTTRPVGQGAGLGLSISHGIVQKHKGKIEVETEEGVGSTFTIFLPQE
ncbi:MAG: ATP-binding protein [Cyclobacteriaceae bacterium]|nr:ATP-binding protein [Cyclobacteriaceae bacterium]